MPDAARKDDPHSCPRSEPGPTPHKGGTITTGSDDVFIDFKKAARAGVDAIACEAGPPGKISHGCETVYINHKLAARVDDMTTHDGKIMSGCSSVVIGVKGDAKRVLASDPHTPAKKADAKDQKAEGEKGKSESEDHNEDSADKHNKRENDGVVEVKELDVRADHDLEVKGLASWQNQSPNSGKWEIIPDNWWFVNSPARTTITIHNNGPSQSANAEAVVLGVYYGSEVLLGRNSIPVIGPGESVELPIDLMFPMSRTEFFGEIELRAVLAEPGRDPYDYADINNTNNANSMTVCLVDPLLPAVRKAGFSFGTDFASWDKAWKDACKYLYNTLGMSYWESNILEQIFVATNNIEATSQLYRLSAGFSKTILLTASKNIDGTQRSWRDGETKGSGAFRVQGILNFVAGSSEIVVYQQGDPLGEPDPNSFYSWGSLVGYVSSWHRRNDF